jgi:hypothetical protein
MENAIEELWHYCEDTLYNVLESSICWTKDPFKSYLWGDW